MAERRPANLLEIKGLNVYYGRSHALQGVDLTLAHGVLSLVGRNGMGKTTLCNAIVGLTPATSGSVRFMGEELTGKTPAEIARLGLGYVPQGRRLWPTVTVEEHLRLAGGNRGQWTITRIYDTFPRLAERRNNRGNQLSGGEQQMLAIGRALMLCPKLLILDEATEGLAPIIREKIWDCLATLQASGLSILLIDKNLDELAHLAHRAYIMEKGCIVWKGQTAELVQSEQLRVERLGV
jgi:ABC-type branched-subunit amino acid transport system ATPase component